MGGAGPAPSTRSHARRPERQPRWPTTRARAPDGASDGGDRRATGPAPGSPCPNLLPSALSSRLPAAGEGEPSAAAPVVPGGAELWPATAPVQEPSSAGARPAAALRPRSGQRVVLPEGKVPFLRVAGGPASGNGALCRGSASRDLPCGGPQLPPLAGGVRSPTRRTRSHVPTRVCSSAPEQPPAGDDRHLLPPRNCCPPPATGGVTIPSSACPWDGFKF